MNFTHGGLFIALLIFIKIFLGDLAEKLFVKIYMVWPAALSLCTPLLSHLFLAESSQNKCLSGG